ncbi:MAG: hypothetical protein GX558_02575, partial [Clostridiales bacterium]|nr:hypothetical protein [Clostridiales bacterium]
MAQTTLIGEPHALRGKRMPFLNWSLVRPGELAWLDEAGRNIAVVGDAALDASSFRALDRPFGIQLRVLPAERVGPVLSPARGRDESVSITSLLAEGGRWRAWGRYAAHSASGAATIWSATWESDDGYDWQRPALGIVTAPEGAPGNLLPNMGHFFVFRDPAGPPEERYKAIGEDFFSPEEWAAYQAARPGDYDPIARRTDVREPHGGQIFGARGWVSPDGIHWSQIAQPLVVCHTDTLITCGWDEERQKYVAYTREWAAPNRADYPDWSPAQWIGVGRRSIGRAESDDFRRLPLPTKILEPRLDWRPNQVLYTNGKTTFPGAPGQHLLFPTVWDMGDDSTAVQVASSSDGIAWGWLPGGPVLEQAPFGAWDGGA